MTILDTEKIKRIDVLYKEILKLHQHLELNKLDIKELKDLVYVYLSTNKKKHLIAVIYELISKFYTLNLTAKQLFSIYYMFSDNVLELGTGQGKTIVIGVVAALFALKYKHVHITTFNDFLAERDQEELEPFFKIFDLKSDFLSRKKSYSDENIQIILNNNIVYSNSEELCFAFIKSFSSPLFFNMLETLKVSIVDEIDGILVDKNTVPLILSQSSGQKDKMPETIVENILTIKSLIDEGIFNAHYIIPKGKKTINMSAKCLSILRRRLKLLKKNIEIKDIFLLKTLLLIKHFYRKNIEYIVQDNNVYFVDPTIGRVYKDIQFGEGIHEILRVLEGCEQKVISRHIDFVIYSSFFRKYLICTGASGTVFHCEKLINKITFNSVVRTRTNMLSPNVKTYEIVCDNNKEKARRILKIIHQAELRPVLIITSDIRESLYFHTQLSRYQPNIRLLHAGLESYEKMFLQHAGEKGAITITTHMCSRGIDIKIGGDIEEYIDDWFFSWDKDYMHQLRYLVQLQSQDIHDKGGLIVICTQHFSDKRIDMQIAGRTGRQDLNGEVYFFSSPQDKIFVNNQVKLKVNQVVSKPKIKGVLRLIRKLQNKEMNEYENTIHQLEEKESIISFMREFYCFLRKSSLKNIMRTLSILNMYYFGSRLNLRCNMENQNIKQIEILLKEKLILTWGTVINALLTFIEQNQFLNVSENEIFDFRTNKALKYLLIEMKKK